MGEFSAVVKELPLAMIYFSRRIILPPVHHYHYYHYHHYHYKYHYYDDYHHYHYHYLANIFFFPKNIATRTKFAINWQFETFEFNLQMDEYDSTLIQTSLKLIPAV